MKTIKELCKEIKGIYNIDGRDNTEITGISADSRKIEKGFLFVCIARYSCGIRRHSTVFL